MSIVTTVSFASDIGKNDLFLTIVATHFRQELISKMICKYPPNNNYLENGSSEILLGPWGNVSCIIMIEE